MSSNESIDFYQIFVQFNYKIQTTQQEKYEFIFSHNIQFNLHSDMKSGFVQLIVKNRLASKPIDKSPYITRYQPVDSFRKFFNQTLPKMQQSVQIQLLKKNLQKIKSSAVRKQLINAYLRRLFRLRQYEKDEIQSYKAMQQIEQQPVMTLPDPTIFKDINAHSIYDIGSYVVFSNDDYNRVFKHGCFGNYSQREYEETNKFGIQIRKDGLGVTQVMKLIQDNVGRNLKEEWTKISKMQPQEKVQYVNDEVLYPLLFNDLTNHIYATVKQWKDKQTYMRIWGSSVIPDTICHSVLQNLDKIQEDPFKFVEREIAEIMQMPIAPSAGDFANRFKEVPCNALIQVKSKPSFFANFYYQTPSFKNVFLGGLAGSGKSMTLAYVAMWAFKNNWIVVNVPSAYKWTNDRKAKYERAYNGLYVIHEHAVEWLDQFKTCNEHLLGKIQFNPQIYGKFDITGTHEKEYAPVPNLWDERRKVHFDQIEKVFKHRMDQATKLKEQKQAALRITDVLKTPKSIIDIIDAGMKNPEYATCAMAQVLHQVYESNHLICELVDGFSQFYRPCWYQSFKYFNDRGLFGHIPPYHVAHCRMFVHLDGHKLKNGFKVVASSNWPLYKHKFDIKKIMFPEIYQHVVPNLSRQQFDKAGRYNILTGYWPADQIQRANLGYVYTISQGNWGDFEGTVRLGHYY